MSSVIISKDRMREILSALMEEKRVAAPVSSGKVIDFLETTDAGAILMGDEIAYKSPKEFFFPRCEKIITFKDDEAVAEMPEKGLVLFGARPCDLEALRIMTAVFTTGKFQDPFFQANLDASLIIGVGCLEKKPGCFCELRETDMRFSDNCDLFLKNAGDSYEALYVSEKGREAFGGFMPELNGFENTERGRTLPDAAIQTSDPEEGGSGGMSNENTLSLEKGEIEMFDKVDWGLITETCQGCGLCTYICPTCHCFVFKDVEDGGAVCRYRNWDSCMFPKFTLHASGHNPRSSVRERYRQRILHKYSYVKDNFGYVACTGCGRCVRSCPAGMNIRTIVEGIIEELG